MTIDEAVLEEARKAQMRLIEVQRDAERARVDYHHEIRRLHAAGGSLREIADALGLSHQRVHQIVDEEEPARAAETVLSRLADRVRKLRVGFAEPARAAVVGATAQARARGSRDVEAQDILVAVLREPGEPTSAILGAAGVDVTPLNTEAAGAAAGAGRKRLGFSQSAKSALERGLREAMALGVDHIGREHLLLGVLALDDPDVDALLERIGTNREALRNATLSTLGAST